MSGATIDILGVANVERMLDKLSGPELQKVSRAATRKGGLIVRRAMKAQERSAFNTGYRRRAKGGGARPTIYGATSMRTLRKSEGTGVEVGPLASANKSGRAYHAHLVDKGHAIVHGKKGAPTGRVPAHPFVDPAFETSKAAAEQAVEQYISDYIKGLI